MWIYKGIYTISDDKKNTNSKGTNDLKSFISVKY